MRYNDKVLVVEDLLSNQFNVALLTGAIPVAEKLFNSLPRKVGHKKGIDVKINARKSCFDITLTSDIPLSANNYLRAAQYFSKVLAIQPGMSKYIVGGRLLAQKNLCR